MRSGNLIPSCTLPLHPRTWNSISRISRRFFFYSVISTLAPVGIHLSMRRIFLSLCIAFLLFASANRVFVWNNFEATAESHCSVRKESRASIKSSSQNCPLHKRHDFVKRNRTLPAKPQSNGAPVPVLVCSYHRVFYRNLTVSNSGEFDSEPLPPKYWLLWERLLL